MDTEEFIFKNWLENLCENNNNIYYLNIDMFKSFLFKNKMEYYIERLTPYLKNNKYIEEPYTYKKTMTLFRQLCKKFNIRYEYKIRYIKSEYFIDYYFHM